MTTTTRTTIKYVTVKLTLFMFLLNSEINYIYIIRFIYDKNQLRMKWQYLVFRSFYIPIKVNKHFSLYNVNRIDLRLVARTLHFIQSVVHIFSWDIEVRKIIPQYTVIINNFITSKFCICVYNTNIFNNTVYYHRIKIK